MNLQLLDADLKNTLRAFFISILFMPGLTVAAEILSITTLHGANSSDGAMDILYVGLGYPNDSVSQANFNNNVDVSLGFLQITPFKEYQNYLRVERVNTVSTLDDMSALKTLIASTSTRAPDRIIFITNGATSVCITCAYFGGDVILSGGASGSNYYYNATTTGHELGHSIGRLADEYWPHNTDPKGCYSDGTLTYKGAELPYTNITINNNLATIKWKQWLTQNGGALGAAAVGGKYCSAGVYRPTNNSLMKTTDADFDVVGREAMVLGLNGALEPRISRLPEQDINYVPENQLYMRFEANFDKSIRPVGGERPQVRWYVDTETCKGKPIWNVAIPNQVFVDTCYFDYLVDPVLTNNEADYFYYDTSTMAIGDTVFIEARIYDPDTNDWVRVLDDLAQMGNGNFTWRIEKTNVVTGNDFTYPQFSDVTASVGVSGTLKPQLVAGGIIWIDYDNDGWQDLFIPNRSGNSVFYRNLGDVNADGVHDGFEVQSSGMPSANGGAVGDYDGDGLDDLLLVTNAGVTMFKVLNASNGYFLIDYTSTLGLDVIDSSAGTHYSANFGDLDGDGDLDIYVTNWGGPNNLYINHVNESAGTYSGKFEQRSMARPDSISNLSWAAIFTDFDEDGNLDIYELASDGVTPNVLYMNDGNANFTADTSTGMAVAMRGQGIATADYNLDGKLDYYVTSGLGTANDPNVLLQKTNSLDVVRRESVAAVTGVEGTLTDGYPAFWGAVFLDANNDGYPDIYTVNDITASGGGSQIDVNPNRLYVNDGNTLSSNGPAFLEFGNPSNAGVFGGVGVAKADYDNDGRVDLVMQNSGGKVTLLRNTSPQQEWLQLHLDGVVSNNRGIGAKVNVTSTDVAGATITQTQVVASGSSHGSSNALPISYGFLAGSSLTNITVTWPSGQVDNYDATYSNYLINKNVTLTEGIDSDGDGLTDAQELAFGLNPTERDSDNDGLSDFFEVNYDGDPTTYDPYNPVTGMGTDLNADRSDTDGDGILDLDEINIAGNNPVDGVFAGVSISSIMPTSGSASQIVELEGRDFCANDCSETTVTFNGVAVTPLSITATSIRFVVPAGVAVNTVVPVAVSNYDSAIINFRVTDSFVSFMQPVRSESTISIRGNVIPANFGSYTLTINDSNNTPVDGSTLVVANNGSQAVNNGELAVWDTTSIITSGLYTAKLVVTLSDTTTITVSSNIVVDPSLHVGWPISVASAAGGALTDHLIVADINGDNKSDLIIGYGNSVRIYDHNGNMLQGWPQSLDPSGVYGAQKSPAVGDMTGDGLPNIAVSNNKSKIFVWNADGTLVPGWPKLIGGSINSVAIDDINGDGVNELIASDWGSRIKAIDKNGNYLSGLDNVSLGGGFLDHPAIADMTGDGNKEIAVVSTYTDFAKLHLVDSSGNVMTGWPRIISNSYTWSEPAVGDINGDGDMEIVIGSGDGNVYAFHHDGNDVVGWPIHTQNIEVYSPVIGDITGDGLAEIVIGNSNTLYAWHGDGSVVDGWPISTGGFTTPVLVDISHDGIADVIASQANSMQAYYGDGTVIPGFFKPTQTYGAWNTSSPAVADMNGDGLIDLAWVDANRNLYLWDLSITPTNANPWPMYRANSQKTANVFSYAAPVDIDSDGLTDVFEAYIGALPGEPDSDNDVLTDYEEVCYDGNCFEYKPFPVGGDLDLQNPDTDIDNLEDGFEVGNGLNPLKPDTDNDGLSDFFEVNYDGDATSYDPYDPLTGLGSDLNASLGDTDIDGVSDEYELNTLGTLPLNPDSDGDGYYDGVEDKYGSDPLISADIPTLPQPVITNGGSAYPPVGARTGILIIQGSDFCFQQCGITGVDNVETQVTLNGIVKNVEYIKDFYLGIQINSSDESGVLQVTTPGGTASGQTIVYRVPRIDSVSPQSGPAGTKITVTGNDLCQIENGYPDECTPGTYPNAVVLHNQVVTNFTISLNELIFEVPAGMALGTDTLTITNYWGSTESAQMFTVEEGSAHEYTALNPNLVTGAVNVVSLTDNNVIQTGSTTLNLNQYELGVIPAGDLAQGVNITGIGAFDIGANVSATDMLLPKVYAGTQFVIPHYRNTHTYFMQSPKGNAIAQIQVGAINYSVPLIEGDVVEFNAGSDNGLSGIIQSDLPILVSHTTGSGSDVYAVPPASLEIFGIRSNQAYIGAFSNNTNVSIYAEDGSSNSIVMNAGDSYAISIGFSASQGMGNAYHVVADQPIAGIQVADGDGIELSAFMRTEDLATQFGIPVDAQYVAVVCPTPGTLVNLYDDTGAVTKQRVCLGDALTPGKAYFGSSVNGVNISAGSYLQSNMPIYVMYEDSATNAERNLLGSGLVTPVLDVIEQTTSVTKVITTTTPATIGGTLGVAWAGIASPTAYDWVGVFEVGAAAYNYLDWVYTAGLASGSATIDLIDPNYIDGATYEIRLYQNDTYTLLDNGTSFVLNPTTPTVILTSTSVTIGDSISVAWSGINTPTVSDWIGISEVGAANTIYLDWIYLKGLSSGVDNIPLAHPVLEVGKMYELRLFAKDNFDLLGSSNAFILE